MPNVWLKSRMPGLTARVPNHWVYRTSDGGYADLFWEQRHYVYSHDVTVRNEAGLQETWLVFNDIGPAKANASSLRLA